METRGADRDTPTLSLLRELQQDLVDVDIASAGGEGVALGPILSRLAKAPNLERLNLSNNLFRILGVPNPGICPHIQDLCDMFGNQNLASLRVLILSKNLLVDNDVVALAKALPPSLAVLDLSENRIANPGVNALGPATTQLEYLVLRENLFTDLSEFAESLQKPACRLTSLNVAGACMAESHWASLFQAVRKNFSLERLGVGNLGASWIRALVSCLCTSKLLPITSLQIWNLDSAPARVLALACLNPSCQLRSLELMGEGTAFEPVLKIFQEARANAKCSLQDLCAPATILEEHGLTDHPLVEESILNPIL